MSLLSRLILLYSLDARKEALNVKLGRQGGGSDTTTGDALLARSSLPLLLHLRRKQRVLFRVEGMRRAEHLSGRVVWLVLYWFLTVPLSGRDGQLLVVRTVPVALLVVGSFFSKHL